MSRHTRMSILRLVGESLASSGEHCAYVRNSGNGPRCKALAVLTADGDSTFCQAHKPVRLLAESLDANEYDARRIAALRSATEASELEARRWRAESSVRIDKARAERAEAEAETAKLGYIGAGLRKRLVDALEAGDAKLARETRLTIKLLELAPDPDDYESDKSP